MNCRPRSNESSISGERGAGMNGKFLSLLALASACLFLGVCLELASVNDGHAAAFDPAPAEIADVPTSSTQGSSGPPVIQMPASNARMDGTNPVVQTRTDAAMDQETAASSSQNTAPVIVRIHTSRNQKSVAPITSRISTSRSQDIVPAVTQTYTSSSQESVGQTTPQISTSSNQDITPAVVQTFTSSGLTGSTSPIGQMSTSGTGRSLTGTTTQASTSITQATTSPPASTAAVVAPNTQTGTSPKVSPRIAPMLITQASTSPPASTTTVVVASNTQTNATVSVVKVATTSNQQTPGVSLYITDPTSAQKILPATSPSAFPFLGAAGSNTLSISACRGQFEPASIVIRPTADTTGITVDVTDLTGPNGAVISKSAVDLRVVKCWYQAGTTSYLGTKVLVPELLLKDDNLVAVDQTAYKNYLKVTIGGVNQYLDVSSPTAAIPSNAQIYDATTLQPFSVAANTNKQMWVTFHVPQGANPGNYVGQLKLTAGAVALGTVGIQFDLYYLLTFSGRP